MTLTPIACDNPVAVSESLLRRGVSPVKAHAISHSLATIAFILDEVSSAERDAVAVAATTLGIEVLTGEGWALLSGTSAKLAGLIRPGFSELPRTIAEEIGRYLCDRTASISEWSMARGTVPLEGPVVVGILNVTPDSFSDGGRFLDSESAIQHASHMLESGAEVIDIGSESTRPGVRSSVNASEEWERLEPVLKKFVACFPDVPVSVDTVKSEVARRALDAGAWAINDVSGLRLDPEIANRCAEAEAGLVLMHSRGPFSEMATYHHASYEDVTAEVIIELKRSLEEARQRGVGKERIVLDPGLGFSKDPGQNYQLLGQLSVLAGLGYPVMVGPSRKRFLGAVTGQDVSERDVDTAAVCVAAALKGAKLFRVHAVDVVSKALKISNAIAAS